MTVLFATYHIGDIASVLSLVISCFTLWAAKNAEASANSAVGAITRYNALGDLVDAQNIIADIQTMHRSGEYTEALKRYVVVKRAIATVLSSSLKLTEDERDEFARLRDDLNDFQRKIERHLAGSNKGVLDIVKFNDLLFTRQDALISITARYRQMQVK